MMLKKFFPFALLIIMATADAQQSIAPNTTLPEVGLSIIKTSSMPVREGLVFSGGSFSKEVETIFSAVLVKHGSTFLLFDSGLGTRIAHQYQQDMPVLDRPFFKYRDPVTPVRAQLDKAVTGSIKAIILSHSHWDHASGITDFPEAEVWTAPEEMDMIKHASSGLGGAWPSQVSSDSIHWKSVEFKPVSYEGFERSLDVFSDGKVVLVPMSGHTPGSIGMFVTVDSGKRYFFVGDVVWNAGALQEGRPKFWVARLRADRDAKKTQETIEQIRRVLKNKPDTIVVPAHDGAVQNALGLFPAWLK